MAWTKEQNEKWHSVIDKATPVEEIRYNYGGMKYVSPAYVLKQLNEAFDEWDFQVLSSDIKTSEHKGQPVTFSVVHGRMTIPGLGAREQFGCQNILAGADALSESLKMAATDCMKKCASMFGICLDLYESDAPNNQKGGQQQRTQGTFQPRQPVQSVQKPTAQPVHVAPTTQSNVSHNPREEMTNEQKLQIAKIRGLLITLGKDTSESKQDVYSTFLGRKVTSFKEVKPDQYEDLVTYLEQLAEGQQA